MSFYENTLITKQDLPKSELDNIKEKYSDLINNNSGKVIKVEEWGLLNLARKIKDLGYLEELISSKAGSVNREEIIRNIDLGLYNDYESEINTYGNYEIKNYNE